MKIDVRQWTWYWKLTWAVLVVSFGMCLWQDSPRGLLVCAAAAAALVIPGTVLRIGRKRVWPPSAAPAERGDSAVRFWFVGRVDEAEGRQFRCTIFRNSQCDDPRLVVFERGDFDREPENGEWFRGCMTDAGFRIAVAPREAHLDDGERELERLLKELPEEF